MFKTLAQNEKFEGPKYRAILSHGHPFRVNHFVNMSFSFITIAFLPRIILYIIGSEVAMMKMPQYAL